MFFPTKATVKLDNGNMGHDKGIGIILCRFPNCYIIYQVVPVYYYPGHPFNNISSCALKLYVGFQRIAYKPIEHCDFVNPQGCSWISTYQNIKNTIFKSKLSKLHLKETEIFLSQLSVSYQNIIPIGLFI